jgi:hypothetical protein
MFSSIIILICTLVIVACTVGLMKLIFSNPCNHDWIIIKQGLVYEFEYDTRPIGSYTTVRCTKCYKMKKHRA